MIPMAANSKTPLRTTAEACHSSSSRAEAVAAVISSSRVVDVDSQAAEGRMSDGNSRLLYSTCTAQYRYSGRSLLLGDLV